MLSTCSRKYSKCAFILISIVCHWGLFLNNIQKHKHKSKCQFLTIRHPSPIWTCIWEYQIIIFIFSWYCVHWPCDIWITITTNNPHKGVQCYFLLYTYCIHNFIKLFKNRSRCSRHKRKLPFNKMSYDMAILKKMVKDILVYVSSTVSQENIRSYHKVTFKNKNCITFICYPKLYLCNSLFLLFSI